MAQYKDVEGYRKLFDEEYKKTRKLISEGETHLDNLAEGFSEASRVIDRMPTADVVPRAEVEKIIHTLEQKRVNDIENAVKIGYRAAKQEVAREIFAEIESEITAALKNNYARRNECNAETDLLHTANISGKIACLRGLADFVAELKKKYTEVENDRKADRRSS